MSEYKSEFLKTLQARGFIKQVTHEAELDAYCMAGVPVAYIGFDATADSLHVGSLLQIMMLRHLQKAGGKPVNELDVDRLDSIERMRLKVALETVAMLRTLLEQRLRLETVR